MVLKSKYKGNDIDVSFRLNEWMKAVRSPPPYRLAGRSLNFKTVRLAKMLICVLLILTVITLLIPALHYGPELNHRIPLHAKYNDTYPLSPHTKSRNERIYRIGAIADLDVSSKSTKESNTWRSYFKRGYLSVGADQREVSVRWDDTEIVLSSHLAEKGRGLELSELIVFNGKLYTCDDRSGIVFEVDSDSNIFPWVVLLDGNGHVSKGKPYTGHTVIIKIVQWSFSSKAISQSFCCGQIFNFLLATEAPKREIKRSIIKPGIGIFSGIAPLTAPPS